MSHVHYCATCDGAFYKNKDIVVIGGGNSALQYALELAQYCNKVEICTVMDKLQGEQNLIEKVENNKKIKVNYCFVTNKIDKHSVYAEDDSKLAADGVFIAIGHKPDTSYYNNCAKEKGLFLTDELCAVNSQGFYAVGDCRKKPFNQVVIAMSDGCIAAMDIIRTMSK